MTLHGPGGAGKTRLALELAGRLAPAREHLFADLGALERAAPVWPSLVPLVEAREEPGMGTPDAVWTLSRAGRESLLRDSKGMRYPAALIAAGGRDVHVLELAGAGVEEPGAELLDDEARSAYRRRLAELEEEVDEAERFADPERLARLREEREALMGELAAAVGLGGRSRRSPSSGERARKAVTNRIRDALARIEREDPELGAHLRRSVSMGAECSYRPEPGSPWSLRVA
ncbi:MAG TPA: hypothetical protein VGF25_05235 [Thermoleophilaceae bacterium]